MKNFLNGIAAGLALAVLMFLLIMPNPSNAAEKVKFNGVPVSDQANIISDEKEVALNKQLVDFYKKTDRQVAVVTINSLDGQEIQPYATEYFRMLGIGSKELNDGVLFLIAPNDRKMRIEVGYGLEGSLTDAHSGRILDGIKPFFRDKNYDGGVQYGVDGILPLVTPEAVEQAAAAKAKTAIEKQKSDEAISSFFGWVFTILLGLAGLLGFGWLVSLPSRRRKAEEERTAREKLEAEQAERRRVRDAENAAYVKAQEQRRAAERAEENRKAEERARKERERREKEEREWQEYLKNETPSQKTVRLAKEEAERIAKAEAARLAAIEAAAQAEKRRVAEEQAAAERKRRRKAEEELENSRRSSYDNDYYSRSSSSSSSSGWGSSSSDWGSSSSSSSSSYDFGGGSSGGGGSDSSW